jgi:transcription antitermination factor NusG
MSESQIPSSIQNARVPELFQAPSNVQWFAAYTSSRHEKSVAKQLEERSVEHLLPLYDAVHRWKNGRHKVQLPLFPGYIFVRINSADRFGVLQVPGLLYLVGTHGTPTALPPTEIEQLSFAMRLGVVAQPFPYLKVGTRVEIKNGPMQGLTGILKRWRGKLRIIVSLDLISQSVAVEVDANDVALVPPKAPAYM